MSFSSITIQGNIVSSEIIDKIRNEDIRFQQPADFGLDRKTSLRDEIGVAWAAARAHYTAFQLRLARLKEKDTAAGETRNSWVLPLLRELGYDVEKAPLYLHPETQKSYAISHRTANRGDFPIHIVGIREDLDKRSEAGGRAVSPHGLTQEYLNLTEHTYALVTNGRYLRLLRDATRLVRLSYLEFDLVKMMEEELYADFALFFRLLHSTRMPVQADLTGESSIEYYHEESLASGSRIREKLSVAVEKSIKELANGFLTHSANEALRRQAQEGSLPPADIYLHLLRLVYRFLFLIVTEERNLVYPDTKDETVQRQRSIYYAHYSIERLRRLAGRLHFVDRRKHDGWEGLKSTFLLFEKGHYGEKLGIRPLGSGLFAPNALGELLNSKLSNEILLKVIRNLTLFENAQGQWVRVNYSDLDVEEFGSVYEGLLEYDAAYYDVNGAPQFRFIEGKGRSSSGSHYTPEELVKPLIRHSLDYIIEEKLKAPQPEKALLSIRVCDVACGSGHILLSAARRIATELARIRTGEDQPAPPALRTATRDVIRQCIYGVDKNPLAVELCKVALWLEAHNPGEPLNFLDHHIKCGDAIVGLAQKEELQHGIAVEAFKTLPGDDKTLAALLAKNNKTERKYRDQTALDFEGNVAQPLGDVLKTFQVFSAMPERTPAEVEAKAAAYEKLRHNRALEQLKRMADIQVGQFFLPKTEAHQKLLVTDAEYFRLLHGDKKLTFDQETRYVLLAMEKRFFHWFLEFPEVFQQGGFDCVLGNPPYLNGTRISTNFSSNYFEYLKSNFAPAGNRADYITYFVRRSCALLKKNSFSALITTNSIAESDTRKGGLEHLLENNFQIVFAYPSIRWPGKANVVVSLISLYSGHFSQKKILKSSPCENINSQLTCNVIENRPHRLIQNQGQMFMGYKLSGEGFYLSPQAKESLFSVSKIYSNVVLPVITGQEINSIIDSNNQNYAITFYDWSLEQAKAYPEALRIIIDKVKPFRQNSDVKSWRAKWWLYGDYRPGLIQASSQNQCCYLTPVTSKYLFFIKSTPQKIFTHSIYVTFPKAECLVSIYQSSLHEIWARKFGSFLKQDPRYSAPDCFESFPVILVNNATCQNLTINAREYFDFRDYIKKEIQLGLTKTYNLFHAQPLRSVSAEELALDDKAFEKSFGKDAAQLRKHLAKTPGTIPFNEAVTGIEKLRTLHVEMDQAVLEAYGWNDIQLRHAFYEVDYLPENDRTRYTIHPDARREVLKRLLELNHQYYEEEIRQGLHKEEEVQKFYAQKGIPVPAEVLQIMAKTRKDKPVKKKKEKTSGQKDGESVYRQPGLFGEQNLFSTEDDAE